METPCKIQESFRISAAFPRHFRGKLKVMFILLWLISILLHCISISLRPGSIQNLWSRRRSDDRLGADQACSRRAHKNNT